MSDIAKMADVSVSTVSRALAGSSMIPEALREKITAIAEEHGYVVNQAARNLRLQTTNTIGLILPMGHETGQQVTDPFLLELIGHLSEDVFKRGYDLLMSKNPAPRQGWLKDLVQSHRFDGMLVLGQSDQHEQINALAHKYPPMVVWGERLDSQSYCSVGVDNVFGGRLATEHLIGRSRKQILFLGPTQVPEVSSRLRGYKDALKDAGVPVRPGQIVEAHFTYDSAYQTVRDLLVSRRKFDAIFCASDVIALAAITALTDSGRRVPEDVAVCGFDDVAMARSLTPPLTTIKQDLRMGAQMMVDLLFQRLGGDKTSSAVIPASLIVRAST
ncbi:LacI family DNA-binding transcriptional regulator [Asticcacaulis machinosus]|uniref:LacI family DNA-binding transcriptional regulator n=1 Tax=Asticcacaulis machinosus TaxID=2984211 RepID=A0ABT5HNI3_9CAUL|nr:LacI family DNA-binding transcriptional regulator [Asticcacaulis machinosus]MDC7677812.1 LacI family DNA-binding transcriptional regulator [Asticcacaulis machinosus]